MRSYPLPYLSSPLDYFESIKNEHWAILLDSGFNGAQVEENNRFDILSARPKQTLTFKDDIAQVFEQEELIYEHKDIYQAMFYMLQEIPDRKDMQFFGGLIGYLSYDIGNEFYRPKNKGLKLMPKAVSGLYDWCLIIDHKNKQTQLRSYSKDCDLDNWYQVFTKPNKQTTDQKTNCSTIKHFLGLNQYKSAITKIKNYLKEGDSYQVNFSQKISLKTTTDSFRLYKKLRKANKVPFGAFLNYPFSKILSFSPECFLTLSDGVVETYPIKGTVQRVKNKKKDKKLIAQLINSGKDKAENLMIVDLMRNDLSKVCKKGSIKVPELFKIKSFKYVHHMQSKIVGKLKKNKNIISLLKSCFPGGSITGAPKKRAMEIIDELENHDREIYCGSIYYMTNKQMVSNIAIRTAVHKNDELFFWAGGGIVNDSKVNLEYQEALDKAKVFTNLID